MFVVDRDLLQVETEVVAGKPIELGAAGQAVAANVRRLRGDTAYTELSRRLTLHGRDIPPLGLRRIEEGARRVDSDDLVALAAALDVSPMTLLMPHVDDADEQLAYAGIDQLTARELWRWLSGGIPLPPYPPSPIPFLVRALPPWKLDELAPGLAASESDPDAAERELRKRSRGNN